MYHFITVTCTCGFVLARVFGKTAATASESSDCPFYHYNLNMQYTFTGYRGKITENIQCSLHSCSKPHDTSFKILNSTFTFGLIVLDHNFRWQEWAEMYLSFKT